MLLYIQGLLNHPWSRFRAAVLSDPEEYGRTPTRVALELLFDRLTALKVPEWDPDYAFPRSRVAEEEPIVPSIGDFDVDGFMRLLAG
ncbi:hypothetical protein [Rathayibacter sp. Leaf248]|uniref:hypothetical protein n=1 Tax=Rathayibacter sp. Leaf248 TaxID=2876555 RepID=UPI001E2CF07B|nr:hypothetical protein [Rathayibacter sp. Leaf248]